MLSDFSSGSFCRGAPASLINETRALDFRSFPPKMAGSVSGAAARLALQSLKQAVRKTARLYLKAEFEALNSLANPAVHGEKSQS